MENVCVPQQKPYGAARVPVVRAAAASREPFAQPNTLMTLLGAYLSQADLLEAHAILGYVEQNGLAGAEGQTWQSIKQLRADVRTTRIIHALNDGRVWARRRLVERLAPLVPDDVSLAIVPSHDPFRTDTPLRRLARELAQARGSIDATGCLVRHAKINRIVFGGKSRARLHRESIRIEQPELVAGQCVLLLDDVQKSGASLRACRRLLYEAGSALVQAAALGAVRE